MDTSHFTDIRSLIGALAEAMNLINADLENHHEQTAYLSYLIARETGMEERLCMLCVYAALLHDVGSILYDEPRGVRDIEREAHRIARLGASMLRGLPDFRRVADVIEYCQCPWQSFARCRAEADDETQALLRCSSVVYLADRVVVSLDPRRPALTQSHRIREVVASCRGTVFCPEAADAFLRVSEREYVWLDVLFNPRFLLFFTGEITTVSLERAVVLTQLMSRIIDFRSSFTARHSAGVAASAGALAALVGMSREERLMMEIAGNLHDVGKLKVPRKILEKPAPLDGEEFNIVKEHPYYTRLILMGVRGFEKIADWAALHHEKLNGSGYPFHFGADELDTGARIMAVADVFSAITEDRPYRAGMPKEQSIAVLRGDAERGALDPALVELLCGHYDEINRLRDSASRIAGTHYQASRTTEAAPLVTA
ncbi:MAG: HD domain-containing protein [Oscillibacter sp.]|nr:HD domain-containing protein [Oscillibacter sp.]